MGSSADINPDDVESISVLSCAAVTALYGLICRRRSNFITTKKAEEAWV